MDRPQKLVIYGTGGLGREVHDIAESMGAWEIVGWLDDGEPSESTVRNLPILGGGDWLAQNSPVHVAVAIGSPQVRRRLFAKVKAGGHKIASIISPHAVIGGEVRLGEGVILMQNAVLTSDVQVGEGAILNAGCIAAHDSRLGDFATMAPLSGLMGYATIQEGVNLGAGAIVMPSVTVGEWSIVGAGAVLKDDVPPNVTVVGVPGRVVKTREAGWHQ